MLPINLKKFFWDVKYDILDQKTNKNYIISRLLELGDETAIRWLEQSYSHEDLEKVVRTVKTLSPKSRNYWKLRYLII